MINVVTKSGSNAFHGDAFEFLRNTDLDARNFFDNTRGAFRQNQFGGVSAVRSRRNKVFFFADYQGRAPWKASRRPKRSVPSLQDRAGNLSDVASSLDGNGERTVYRQTAHAKAGLRVSRASRTTRRAAPVRRVRAFPTP
jgi:hypothetical protein